MKIKTGQQNQTERRYYIEPYKQGDADGLCGAYSLINSARLIMKKLSADDCTSLLDKSSVMWSRKKGQRRYYRRAVCSGHGRRDEEGTAK